jgi:hypothetical protein
MMKPGDNVEFVQTDDGVSKSRRMFGIVYYSPWSHDLAVMCNGATYRREHIEIIRYLSDQELFHEALRGNPLMWGLHVPHYAEEILAAGLRKDETEDLT